MHQHDYVDVASQNKTPQNRKPTMHYISVAMDLSYIQDQQDEFTHHIPWNVIFQ